MTSAPTLSHEERARSFAEPLTEVYRLTLDFGTWLCPWGADSQCKGEAKVFRTRGEAAAALRLARECRPFPNAEIWGSLGSRHRLTARIQG